MNGILTEEAIAGGKRGIERGNDGFGGIFASEARTRRVAARIKDEGVNLICIAISMVTNTISRDCSAYLRRSPGWRVLGRGAGWKSCLGCDGEGGTPQEKTERLQITWLIS